MDSNKAFISTLADELESKQTVQHLPQTLAVGCRNASWELSFSKINYFFRSLIFFFKQNMHI